MICFSQVDAISLSAFKCHFCEDKAADICDSWAGSLSVTQTPTESGSTRAWPNAEMSFGLRWYWLIGNIILSLHQIVGEGFQPDSKWHLNHSERMRTSVHIYAYTNTRYILPSRDTSCKWMVGPDLMLSTSLSHPQQGQSDGRSLNARSQM